MRKHFCDRCGKEIKDCYTHWLTNSVYYKRIIAFSPKERCKRAEYEICEDCENELIHWWSLGKPTK